MDRWSGKLAVVTGASAGIGASICIELVKSGMKVIGLARRAEKVEALRKEIPESLQSNLIGIKCDVSKEEEIIQVFKYIDDNFGGISALINNAGIATTSNLLDRNDTDKTRGIIDVNVFGLVFCTREAYSSMEKHGITNGHIIHINSITGHQVFNYLNTDIFKSFNIYHASKHAVTALTETYRQDFINRNSQVKVTVSKLRCEMNFL